MIEFLIVSHCLIFFYFILRDIHTKRQIQTLEQIIKLRERFLSEITELQEVALVVFHEVADCLDIGCLKTVECTNRKILVNELLLEKLTHTEHIFIEGLFLLDVGILEGDLLVGEECEVLNQYSGSLLEGLLGVDGAISGDLNS